MANQQSEIETSFKFTGKLKDTQQVNDKSVTKEKQTSLNTFYLTPNNNEYFIGLIRVLQENEFRVAMMDKNNCWISKSETFEFHRLENNNMSSQNIHQFRNNLVSALTKPNDKDFEIKEIDIDKNKNNKNKWKEIKIFRKARGIKCELATFKLYTGKKNLFYLLEKLECTLNGKRRKNREYKGENIKLQQKYNQQMHELNETISDKNEMEKQLLSKFLLVLNEKNKKIKALQDEISQLKYEEDTVIDDGTLDIEGLSGGKRKRNVLEEDHEQIAKPKKKRRKVA